MGEAPLPVVVVTGFLGSGKTTLLNALLDRAGGARLAVIVNEFGQLDVDGSLMAGDAPIVELPGGCICCQASSDVRRALVKVMENGRRLDGILIETSGLADPGPLAQLIAEMGAAGGVRLADVVCMIDASRFDETLEEAEIAFRQITSADTLMISKIDLVAAEIAAQISAALAHLNADAIIAPASAAALMSCITAAPKPSRARLRRWFASSHESEFEAVTLSVETQLAADLFDKWWSTLPSCVVRAKGFVDLIGLPSPQVVQAVGSQRVREPPRRQLERRGTRVVLIGRDLPVAELQSSLEACIG